MAHTQTQKGLSGQWFGASFLVAAGLAFAAVNTINQHLGMRLGASSVSVTFWQYLIAALLFGPWLWAHRSHLRDGFTLQQFLRVGLGAIGVQCWVASLAHVPIWQAISLLLLSPVFVTLGAGILLRESVGMRRVFAVVLGGIGGAIILAPWSDAFSLYALLPVAAAAFWAAVSLITKKMTATHSPQSLTAYLLLLLIPINFAIAAPTEAGFALPSGAVVYVVIAGGLVALGQYLVAAAYARADAAFLQPFDHVKLLFNVGLGILAFGFAPPGYLWIGAALVMVAITILEKD